MYNQNVPLASFPELKYSFCNDLCVITSYFNPTSYKSKQSNYYLFEKALTNSNIQLYTVELAFDGKPFELKSSENILQIRGGNVMWQKERLLNILVSKLPAKYKKIAWIDCDILFENINWAVETSLKLEQSLVVQLFEQAIRLPKTGFNPENDTETELHTSFAAKLIGDPGCLNKQKWKYHGHTGYAWAARRELFETAGLYDVCITGSADHLMAHTFCGDWTSSCIQNVVGNDTPYSEHYFSWSRKVSELGSNQIGCTSGKIFHLWHGDTKDRNYYDRNQQLLEMKFNPSEDISLDDNKLWKWNTNNPILQEWAINYFKWRNED